MRESQRRAIERYRERERERGTVRVEVRVPEDDAALVRDVARSLRASPWHNVGLRARLHDALRVRGTLDLVQLFRSAPLAGFDVGSMREHDDRVALAGMGDDPYPDDPDF